MRNKVEIRAFAVEQVVKMRCMSSCSIDEIVKQSKVIEEYIIGKARMIEFVDDTGELMEQIKKLGTHKFVDLGMGHEA